MHGIGIGSNGNSTDESEATNRILVAPVRTRGFPLYQRCRETAPHFRESKRISWLVWRFDPEWGPTLISDWDYTLTPSGEFAQKAMHGESDK